MNELMAHYLRGFEGYYPHQLEARFLRVFTNIVALWNNPPAFEAYMSDLMIPARAGRQGFPEDVASEIFALSVAYDRIRGANADEEDLWGAEMAKAELEQLGFRVTPGEMLRAVDAGDRALCRLFVSAGIDVDVRDAREWTPLMIAAFNGNEKMAMQLIRYGANVHARDLRGYTPMHWAAFNGYADVVKLLAEKRAVIDSPSAAGITPLLQAAARGHLPVVERLLAFKANPNLAANDGSTPLLKAVANEHLDVVNTLVAAGASLNARLTGGKSLLEIAAASKNVALRERIEDICDEHPEIRDF